MKLAWLLILVAALFLHPVSTECSDTSQTVNCQEVAKNHSSVPSSLIKDISVLYLSCNHITLDNNDKEILCQYSNLTELYLNNNSIVVVSNYSFEKLSQLKILDVSNNSIETVEKAAFAGLNELQILNLQNNKITQLNSDIFAFPTWYHYLKSYKHRRLQEKEESEMFEETFTPQLCIPPQASEPNEESIVVFEQFHPYVPEDDGFIEDKYIDP
ncbi:leucine-rich repeat-containing protein 19 [Vipera latastei]